LTLFQGPAGFASEELTCLGDGNLSGVAFEESDSDGRLDLTYSLGQGGLGDMTTCGGAGKVALFGHCYHQPHPSQLDLCLHSDNLGQNSRSDSYRFEQICS
jgi:hypothetical protein